MNKTFQPKEKEIKRSWHLIDANDQILGRLAAKVVGLLMGKGKVTYAPHMDSGDYVVVVNAEKVAVTGKKALKKFTGDIPDIPMDSKKFPLKKCTKSIPKELSNTRLAECFRKIDLKRKEWQDSR